jgi:hypothetical protein
MATKTTKGRRTAAREFAWEDWSNEDLLDLRMSELGVTIEGTALVDRIDEVLRELEQRKLRLRPHVWLSDEWSSPDGIPGVAIPFYLAHPRLVALERSQMREVEGGSRLACRKLLRHEIGHAFQHAYQLGRRKGWQQTFGSPKRPYPDYYRPNPRSKSYVLHLGGWYAQSHPSEDFAETFAVWLRPGSDWRRRYLGWPALRKLEYVDTLMAELRDRSPFVRRRSKPYALSTLRKTLREHYEHKREHYPVLHSNAYDRDLYLLFTDASRSRSRETAAAFIRRHRKTLVEMVSRFARDDDPIIAHVLDEMMGRCRELGLRVKGRERRALDDLAVALAVHTVDFGRRGAHWWPV